MGDVIIIAQNAILRVEGSIQVADADDPTPDSGSIRWNGVDFEGWNGQQWISLTDGILAPVTEYGW